MTAEGAQRLKDELEKLKREERPKVIKAIAEARAHGDLRENAEYHAAKEQQGFIEARIRDIEHKLAHAHIIDISKVKNDGRVIFGATVNLIDLDTEKTIRFQIVGDDEADLKHGKISVSSPMARALIGKSEGDTVEVIAPQGSVEYEIESVLY
jgi:transcription elongation factor GreA